MVSAWNRGAYPGFLGIFSAEHPTPAFVPDSLLIREPRAAEATREGACVCRDPRKSATACLPRRGRRGFCPLSPLTHAQAFSCDAWRPSMHVRAPRASLEDVPVRQRGNPTRATYIRNHAIVVSVGQHNVRPSCHPPVLAVRGVRARQDPRCRVAKPVHKNKAYRAPGNPLRACVRMRACVFHTQFSPRHRGCVSSRGRVPRS